MDLDDVADELYGLTPGEFTSTRTARAAAARQAGNRELATAIKELRRPTTGAWLANLLERERHDELLALLELGEETRRAHSKLDAEDLRRLSRQRRQVVAALSHDARRLARDIGLPVSDAVGRELEETLEAAFADPGASEAVRSGRLTTALSYSGLGPLDVTAVVGGGAAVRGAAAPRGSAAPQAAHRKRREGTAIQAVEEAAAALAEARERAGVQERMLAGARDRLEVCRRDVTDLEQRLQDLWDVRDQAADEVGHAEQEHVAADDDHRAAADRLARAQPDLEGQATEG
ncbi:MAG: hypothetical protein ACR2MN_18180 [Acidimicrobiales bacterium]